MKSISYNDSAFMRRRMVETEQIPGSGDWRGRAVGVDNVTIYDIASDFHQGEMALVIIPQILVLL